MAHFTCNIVTRIHTVCVVGHEIWYVVQVMALTPGILTTAGNNKKPKGLKQIANLDVI